MDDNLTTLDAQLEKIVENLQEIVDAVQTDKGDGGEE